MQKVISLLILKSVSMLLNGAVIVWWKNISPIRKYFASIFKVFTSFLVEALTFVDNRKVAFLPDFFVISKSFVWALISNKLQNRAAKALVFICSWFLLIFLYHLAAKSDFYHLKLFKCFTQRYGLRKINDNLQFQNIFLHIATSNILLGWNIHSKCNIQLS